MHSAPATLPRTLLANRATAQRVGEILKRHPNVREVLLFGSIARSGFGNDIDLIVVTDDEHAERFVEAVQEDLGQLGLTQSTVSPTAPDRETYRNSQVRWYAALEVLGETEETSDIWWRAYGAASPAKLDVFVFPSDWRDHLWRLQTDLPNKDPQFMENIAGDAVQIA